MEAGPLESGVSLGNCILWRRFSPTGEVVVPMGETRAQGWFGSEVGDGSVVRWGNRNRHCSTL